MRVRIEGHHLPGRAYAEHTNVHVAVQVGRLPHEPVRGDAREASWEFDVRVVPTDDGPDWRGEAVHGRRGERFLYLTWGDVSDGEWGMFRRAKLMVDDIDAALVSVADKDADRVLVARVHLTDDYGCPRCARVRAPAIEWSVE
ncbi:DUF5990 family protein [Nocardioides sp. Root151]|uniref:DUF5990 family protein n=1 Tax=Nocardioides sp. Root151 TaxID=1736475 RepID=UPI0007027EC9|nr:DUF5990 family protein [Nocardioides sp. Root151]KQZ67279.1 hypothetical protein ASD66_20150 [Nocardioides sp. Root151]